MGLNKCLNLLDHWLYLIAYFRPKDLFPSHYCVFDLHVQTVEFFKQVDFTFGLFKFWVCLVWKTKESLTCLQGLVFSLPYLMLFRLQSQSIHCFSWLNTRDHGAVFHKIFSELFDIFYKCINSQDERLFKGRLFQHQLISLSCCFV